MTMMDDIDREFTWWHRALAGERGPIDADNPKSGFYRWVWKKATGTEMGVVAIWYDSNTGELRYQVDGKDIEDTKARTRWPHDSRRPISEKVFWHFRETGQWLDVDEAAHPPTEAADDSAASFNSEIVKLQAAAKKYAKVESDEEMALAQSVRAKLQEIAGKADKIRVEEKEPHLKAGREVDEKWQPMIKVAKATAESVRRAMEEWNNTKLRAAEQAAARSQASASPTPVASNAPPPSVQVSGGGGRAAHVGVKDVVTEIDLDEAFKFFRDEEWVRDMFTKRAQAAVDAGLVVPGVKTEKRSAIR